MCPVVLVNSKDQNPKIPATAAIATAGFQTSEGLGSSLLGNSSYSEIIIISNSLSENETVLASNRSHGFPCFQQDIFHISFWKCGQFSFSF